jgi:hypothetical protein
VANLLLFHSQWSATLLAVGGGVIAAAAVLVAACIAGRAVAISEEGVGVSGAIRAARVLAVGGATADDTSVTVGGHGGDSEGAAVARVVIIAGGVRRGRTGASGDALLAGAGGRDGPKGRLLGRHERGFAIGEAMKS